MIQKLISNWVALSLTATILLGTFSTIMVAQIRKGMPISFCFVIVAIVWLIGFGYLASQETTKISLLATKEFFGIFLFASVICLFGNWALFAGANLAANPGLAFAIFNVQPVIILTLAFIFLGDRITSLQLLGSAICIGGAIIIQIGGKT